MENEIILKSIDKNIATIKKYVEAFFWIAIIFGFATIYVLLNVLDQ